MEDWWTRDGGQTKCYQSRSFVDADGIYEGICWTAAFNVTLTILGNYDGLVTGGS